MANPFEIYPYSSEKFKSILIKESKATDDVVSQKIHLIYLTEYLSHLNTKTILIENDYIDKDYLEDYSAYYVKCFADYKRKCTRLHFFSIDIDEKKFKTLLEKNNSLLLDEMKDGYLGFIVVKPLPQTIIGRTCLITYSDNEKGVRFFPIVRKYEANLFGISLEIKSLAFQEQDHEVAACATSALWSVFHGTGMLFHHPIPSPVEITKAATSYLPIESRTFPNRGLTPEQMAHAIQSVGLEPLFYELRDDLYTLKSCLYAYLKYGVPIILGIDLYKISDQGHSFIGKHAIAVVGYRLDHGVAGEEDNNLPRMVSSKICKLYVHDDQVGPFARMEFDNKKIHIPGIEKDIDMNSMSTSWVLQDAELCMVRAVPTILLIPLYHKIRIPFEKIFKTINDFNAILETFRENNYLKIHQIIWEIYLVNVNSFKQEIYNDNPKDRKDILMKNMPRFIWRATGSANGKPVLDFLFDATDIEQGEFFLFPIEYDKIFSSLLREVFKEKVFDQFFKNRLSLKIIQWFRKN